MHIRTWVTPFLLTALGASHYATAQPGDEASQRSDPQSKSDAGGLEEPESEPRAAAEPASAEEPTSAEQASEPPAAAGASLSASVGPAGVPAPSGASVQGSAPAESPSTEPASPPWKSDPVIKVGGFIHALYEVSDAEEEPSQAFSVKRARLGVDVEQGELLDGQFELELTSGGAGASGMLRDAYVRVSPMRALRLRLGQFKKPFSAMELWGRGSNPLVSRGVANDWIVETLGYGGRDVGAQVEGRVLESPRLEYAAGVFNGAGANALEDGESKDIVVRLQARPVEWLELGGGGSLKTFDEGGGMGLPARGAMAGIDATAKTKRLTVLAEGAYGQNYLSIDEAKSWSALLLAAYKIPLTDTWKLKLEPLVMAEVLKVEDHVRNAHILAGAAGANLHIGKLFRVMVQGRAVRPMKNTLVLWTDSNRISVQAAFNFR